VVDRLGDAKLRAREREVATRWLPSLATLFARDPVTHRFAGRLGELLVRHFPVRGPGPGDRVEIEACRLAAVKAGPEVAVGLVAECTLMQAGERSPPTHLWLAAFPVEVAPGAFLCGHDRLVVPAHLVEQRVLRLVEGVARRAQYRYRSWAAPRRDSARALLTQVSHGF
jgi:hypothetical protein